jgi:hypothetical protein
VASSRGGTGRKSRGSKDDVENLLSRGVVA